MNGIRYHRLKRGLSVTALARKTSVNLATIRLMERSGWESGVGTIRGTSYLRVRDFFGVPVDELLREDLPEVEEPRKHRRPLGSAKGHPENCFVVYRLRHDLDLRRMAALLDVSHETVRTICARPQPPEKYIRILADKEGCTVEEFIQIYTN